MKSKALLAAMAVVLGAGALAIPELAAAHDREGKWRMGGMDGFMQGRMGNDDRGGMGFGEGEGLSQMFAKVDADGDGKVTEAEIAAYRQARIAGVDANGDGLLSADEIAAAEVARMTEMAQARAEARIAAQDADGDGLLSAAELLNRPVMGAQMFSRLDADGDGAITQEEVQAMAGRFREGGMMGRGDDDHHGMMGRGYGDHHGFMGRGDDDHHGFMWPRQGMGQGNGMGPGNGMGQGSN